MRSREQNTLWETVTMLLLKACKLSTKGIILWTVSFWILLTFIRRKYHITKTNQKHYWFEPANKFWMSNTNVSPKAWGMCWRLTAYLPHMVLNVLFIRITIAIQKLIIIIHITRWTRTCPTPVTRVNRSMRPRTLRKAGFGYSWTCTKLELAQSPFSDFFFTHTFVLSSKK